MKRVLFWGAVVPAVLRRLVPAWFLESPLALAAKHPWAALAAAGALIVAVGVLVAASGVVPITASGGHWDLTERVLQFSKMRSVVTHAIRIETPPLDNPALVLRGAGHYDLGCRPCHGAPGGEVPQLARYMLPVPPHLIPRIPVWRPRELFYIVKHGIKLTGMPAWPAQGRDDEVWAMVAFLRRFPRMDAAEYRRLSRAEIEEPFELGADVTPPPEIVLETCARCHGSAGLGRGAGAFPKLAGQRPEYLDRALRAYAERTRHSGVMGPIAAVLPAQARAEVVRYYSSLTALEPRDAPPDASRAARGATLATRGDAARMIPACVECHGTAAAAKNPAYPILDGQSAEYLALQLRLLQNRQRGGSEYVHLMHSFVDRLTDEEIRDAAAYFESLGATASRGAVAGGLEEQPAVSSGRSAVASAR